MASVQVSRGKKYESVALSGDEPTIHIESEGERLIQNLCIKQLNTNLTLELQKKQEKQFERGTGFVPLSAHSAGSSTLAEMKINVARNERLEELVVLGLTSEEAEGVLNNADLTFPQRKVETSIKLARAEQIRNLLETNVNCLSKEQTSERDGISRHERELALAVKPDSAETRLLQFALSCKKHNVTNCPPLDHPINQLNEMEQALFGQFNPRQLASTVLRKRRQLLEASLPPCGPTFLKKGDDQNGSLWDEAFKRITVKDEQLVKSKIPRICKYKSSKLYTIKNCEIVEVEGGKSYTVKSGPSVEISERLNSGEQFVNRSTDFKSIYDDSMSRSRQLTEEEIKAMPSFKDYSIGVRSKVLYIKNLSKRVKEQDLVALFGRFQVSGKPSIVYRLMGGRMHGQAFVTFPNEYIAEEALKCTNGRFVEGKPLVIQYGKS